MYAKPADDTAIRPAFAYWGVLVICVVGGIVLGVVPGALLDLVQ
jgi:hypothetical protein